MAMPKMYCSVVNMDKFMGYKCHEVCISRCSRKQTIIHFLFLAELISPRYWHWWSHFSQSVIKIRCACLGHLGKCKTNLTNPVCVSSPKGAKVSTVTVSNSGIFARDLAPNLPFEMSLYPLHKLKQFSKINNFIWPTIPCSLDSSQLKKANIYVVVRFNNCAELMNELMKGILHQLCH